MVVGERIRQARKNAGLTQISLAVLLGVTQSVVGQYERGIRNPKFDALQRIALALNISMDVLLYGHKIDREYELICDTLQSAGYTIAQGTMADEFIIAPADAESAEDSVGVEYSRLVKIVDKVLADAESNKSEYVKKRLDAELFWPRGWALQRVPEKEVKP